jgi:SAM domain (Sterile alpha motif)
LRKCANLFVESGTRENDGMSDLREWLRSNKFEQYADAFEANDIDLDILAELSDHDLEQLGLSLGNRRRLMKAIAGRGTEVARSEPSNPEAPGSGDADRRQVTVLFADMVGSTALSGKVDPELLSAAKCESGWGDLSTWAPFETTDCHPTPPLISFASTLPSPGG